MNIKCITYNDVSACNALLYLLQMKIVDCSRSFVILNLSGNTSIEIKDINI